MSNLVRRVLFSAWILSAASCSNGAGPFDGNATARQALGALPAVRISELHYDNAGTDVGEAIEVSGPAGTDLSGWQVVLYNGNGGITYGTRALSGFIPATCGSRGVVVLGYPANGIQNGGSTVTGTSDPDGVALIDASGSLVEFLSYEGTFAATNGPALGVTSADIGVRELGTEPSGSSLQRSGAGSWSAPVASTFGACNDAEEQPPAEVATVTVSPASSTIAPGATQLFAAGGFDGANHPVAGVAFTWTSSAPSIAGVDATGLATGVAPGDAILTAGAPNGVTGTATLHVVAAPPPPPPSDVRMSELHYDNVGTDIGEAIEIEGPAGADLTGFAIVLYDGNGGAAYNTQTLSGLIPATCGTRGVVVVNYPSNGIQNGGPDGVALVDSTGHVVEFLSYEGTFTASSGPAAGLLSIDIGVSESTSAPIGGSLQRGDADVWQAGTATFGACNGAIAPPPTANHVSFTGRTASDPPLPIGFQDQMFATVRDAGNLVVPTTITWTSETPDVASVDADGVMTALAAGTATLRATAGDGVTTATVSLPTRVAVASTSARYAGNAEFGEPTDADPSDDFIVRHVEYTLSFNPNRGTPNWVSYDLEVTHFGDEDRCDCFTFDPDLPSSFTRYTTADYTGAGTFHGYGIDRGHLARSFDRTSASLDNAHTFLFSNIVPQASDLNQGPWASLENDLGDLARLQNKEVYIVAGVAGSKGTLKNQGKIVIPARTWKVAVIMPRDHGLADVVDYRDLEVVAVDMPNDPGVRNVPWQSYKTTVQAIEALSGYDLLALLPDKIEDIVQRGIQPPIATLDGPYVSTEGSAVTMSAAGSLDPNGSVVSYAWSFGDGSTGEGAAVTHTFAQDGTYSVRLTITDNDGLTDSIVATASVANVAPVIADLPGATLLPGDAYVAAGGFTDPGADTWSGTVDYGDGSAVSPVAVTGSSFSLFHTYRAAGTFTLTVRISDDDVTSSRSQVVVVLAPTVAIANAIAVVDELVASGKLARGVGLVLKLELGVAKATLDRGGTFVALVELRSVILELDVLVRRGALSPADAAPLRAVVAGVIHALGG